MAQRKRYRAKVTVDGKMHYTHRYISQPDSHDKAVLLKAKLLEGEKQASGDMTVKDWADTWLKTYKKRSVSPYYYDCICGHVDNQILPRIGSKKLRAVEPEDCQEVLNQMADEGLSLSYIKSVRDLLNGMFRRAKANHRIRYNPASDLDLPATKPKQKRRALTDLERRISLQVAETNRGGLFVLIMYYCGCRPQEVALLRWSDIDIEKHLLYITKALKAGGYVGETKTGAGTRAIHIPEKLYERLLKERGEPDDLVVTNTQGGQYTRSSINRMWRSFKRDMQLAAGATVFRNALVPPLPIPDDLTEEELAEVKKFIDYIISKRK